MIGLIYEYVKIKIIFDDNEVFEYQSAQDMLIYSESELND